MEDGCVECTRDADQNKIRADLFIGGNDVLQSNALIRCQNSLTISTYDEVIIRNPANNLTVDTTPLYLEGRGCISPLPLN